MFSGLCLEYLRWRSLAPTLLATLPRNSAVFSKVGLLQARLLCVSALFALIALDGAANAAWSGEAQAQFVRRDGTGFVLGGKPFNVAGVNNHYLSFGSRAEVLRVLDDAVAMNANVVRTFIQPVIGSVDGTSVPTIWDWKSEAASGDLGTKGVYFIYWDTRLRSIGFNDRDDGFGRLDFTIAEAAKRNLKLIIAFLDFWDYTGGAQQIRSWYGSQDKNTFFFSDPRPLEDYRALVKHVLTRRNSVTDIVYKDDPAILGWDLMNEPNIEPPSLTLRWIDDMAAYVKSVDPNHLVGSGHGHEHMGDVALPSIDFGTWHGYPLYFNISNDQFNTMINEFCEKGRHPSLFCWRNSDSRAATGIRP
jgi:mannan endo-1,4-beta-mannosidase